MQKQLIIEVRTGMTKKRVIAFLSPDKTKEETDFHITKTLALANIICEVEEQKRIDTQGMALNDKLDYVKNLGLKDQIPAIREQGNELYKEMNKAAFRLSVWVEAFVGVSKLKIKSN